MSAVEVYEPRNAQALTPLDMLNTAVEKGAAIETIEKLMSLYERFEAAKARKAYDAAIADAKAEIPPILKDKVVDFTSQKGRTNYRYEGFDTVARIVDPILAKHGLSYRFRASQDAKRISVTCIVSHRDGYYEETTLTADEDHSGNKNSIQAIGSSATFLQRYTLKLGLGLSTTNDDDGAASGGNVDTVSDDQISQLQSEIVHVGADVPKFLRFLKIERLEDLPAAKFGDAMECLRKKGQQP